MEAAAADALAAGVQRGDRIAWLSALFAPAAARPPLHALAAYRLELARIVAAAREPVAAEIRLQWWRDAIRDTGAGAGRSLPLVEALREGSARYGWPLDTLCAMSEAHIHDLYADPFRDFAELDGYAGEVFGAPVLLAAMAIGHALGVEGMAAARTAATTAGWAGVALAAADAALAAPAGFAHGRTRVPLAAFADPAAAERALAARRVPEGADAAIHALALHGTRAEGEMRAGLPGVNPAVRAAFLPALVARLRLAAAARRPLAPVPPADWRVQLALWREARRL